ncbi:MAG: helix-turn-helix domain-containing protein [Candidatus Omnitrophota bacterium]|jgi:excisionase family DNA binding protein|nr:helix-turn-helix domain-containing protein [Candidatus Omnitrophota bacterium]
MEKLLKVSEVSEMLQVSPKTVYNWVCYGYIPHFKVNSSRGNGGALRFRQSDLEQWLEIRKQNGRGTFKHALIN